ncbi:hypothetical protein ACQSSU_22580 [Micromonospora echinospora]
MLDWHVLVIIAYFAVLDRQSGLRVSYDSSPREAMAIFGVYIGAPTLLCTLLVGLILLQRLLANSRINSAIVLGTAAASPTLLSAAAAAVSVLG